LTYGAGDLMALAPDHRSLHPELPEPPRLHLTLKRK
jgi:hypothetical protein